MLGRQLPSSGTTVGVTGRWWEVTWRRWQDLVTEALVYPVELGLDLTVVADNPQNFGVLKKSPKELIKMHVSSLKPRDFDITEYVAR